MIKREHMNNRVYYAIGDIHGEAEKLTQLHDRIWHMHDIDFSGQDFTLVHLGDYVDRGPNSFDVLARLIKLKADGGLSMINLKGNHEQMMLEAYQDSGTRAYQFWLRNGGDTTLESYHKAGFKDPPSEHLAWLKNLKTFHWDRNAKFIFVHAGVDPVHFPNDGEDRHLWTRSKRFFDTEKWPVTTLCGASVIHGHTPTQSGLPDIDGDFRRINIDTGACYGGNLTAVILAPNEVPRFLSV